MKDLFYKTPDRRYSNEKQIIMMPINTGNVIAIQVRNRKDCLKIGFKLCYGGLRVLLYSIYYAIFFKVKK